MGWLGSTALSSPRPDPRTQSFAPIRLAVLTLTALDGAKRLDGELLTLVLTLTALDGAPLPHTVGRCTVFLAGQPTDALLPHTVGR